MSSLVEPSSSPCKANSATNLKMTGISNDQPPKVGLTANDQTSITNGQISSTNGQISMENGQSPTKQASNSQKGSDGLEAKNGHKKKSNGGRSNGGDESEARYSEFTRKSILSDPRYWNGVQPITQKCSQ